MSFANLPNCLHCTIDFPRGGNVPSARVRRRRQPGDHWRLGGYDWRGRRHDHRGQLEFLSSGSLFEETAPGKADWVKNGTGTETATLSVEGGFITVTAAV